jgi:hypothetical protein
MDQDKELASFLVRDFEQCFQQMRHYDGQVLEMLKFAFTAYTALFGGALALYRYGVDARIDYRLPASAILLIGFILGLCFIGIFTRNRVYYVAVARYVNEHRSFFLSHKPLGFQNRSEMYTDFTKPPFFHWRSSQTFLLVVLALLNTGLIVGAALISGYTKSENLLSLLFIGVAALAAQSVLPITYLWTREGQSSDRAVFGAR